MYRREARKKAVELYIKYDKSPTAVINELGYPDYKTLIGWYNDYLIEKQTGVLRSYGKYTQKQKKAVVNYYFEHGRCLARTMRAMRYPSKEVLTAWIDELRAGERQKRLESTKCSQEQKIEAVSNLYSHTKKVVNIAKEYGVSTATLFNWEKKLLKGKKPMADIKKTDSLPNDKETLLTMIDDLKKQVHKLQLEKDILEKTAEIIKKDPGVDQKNLTNREKTQLIDVLKDQNSLPELLNFLKIARSSYYYQRKAISLPSKDKKLYMHIKKLFTENNGRYGYRRIYLLLLRQNITVSEKIIRRIMQKLNLVVLYKKRRAYNSYKGELTQEVPNIINRDFQADKPNQKLLTDITEFVIPAGKIYLSPIIDCFDGKVISWTIGTSPDASLVNDMLDMAISKLKNGEYPLIHTDRGCHYRWPGWIERMDKAHLIRSMSKKGCSPDNSACEGFFGRLKNEMFYNRKWEDVSIEKFGAILNDYLIWYNEKRIKSSLNGLSPVEYRRSLNLAA